MTSLSSFDIIFLGTASAQPSSTRNHSSLALRLGSDVWLFDCGEATQHQVQRSKDVRMGRIRKVFITHTHGDHIFGLAPLMASALNGAGGTVGDGQDERVQAGEGTPVRLSDSENPRSTLTNGAAARDLRTAGYARVCPRGTYAHALATRGSLCRARTALPDRPCSRPSIGAPAARVRAAHRARHLPVCRRRMARLSRLYAA